MKLKFSFFLFFFVSLIASAAPAERAQRHLLENTWNSIPAKEQVFRVGGGWFPYPAYSDRQAWEALTSGVKKELIRRGEKAAKEGMEIIKPSWYLQCEKGRRQELTYPVKRNFGRVADLTLAELAEGKGRFMEPLIDALWYMSEVSTWMNPYNSKRGKKSPARQLPDPEDRYISLNAADAAQRVAIAWHFFHEEFDKIDPTISKTILGALRKNTFEPYLDETKDAHGHQWMGLSSEKRVNNWNTYCNMQVLLAFLLAEQDGALLLKALEKGMRSIDRYFDSVGMDGCCDEGPGYWDMAGGKVYDFARMMYDASDGKFNIFQDRQVRNLCEYKAFNYIGDGWVINFADGVAQNSGDVFLPFRMGVDLESETLMNYGLYLQADQKQGKFQTRFNPPSGYRSLESLRYLSRMRAAEKEALEDAGGDFSRMCSNLVRGIGSVRYPDTDQAYLRNGKGWVLGAKGGNNGESHNHNDVGSALLFVDNCPVLIDIGCQVYGPKTFSKERYTLYQNQSDWHNIVTINGVSQRDGAEFSACDSKADLAAGFFSTDIAGAYPAEAACKSWVRSYKLDDKSLTITDSYVLKARKTPDMIHFVTNGTLVLEKGRVKLETLSKDGSVRRVFRIDYPKTLTPSVEAKDVTDKRHLKSWGKQIYRLVFTSSAKAPLSGSYTFKITLEE